MKWIDEKISDRGGKHNVLTVRMKQKWFDMVVKGGKSEEYRSYNDYYKSRIEGKEFDIIRFIMGYSSDAPVYEAYIDDIWIYEPIYSESDIHGADNQAILELQQQRCPLDSCVCSWGFNPHEPQFIIQFSRLPF